MIKLCVEIEFLEEVLGTASGDPQLHESYIASNAPDAMKLKEEIEAIGTEGVFEKSMTVFSRNKDGDPIVWDYQWKGYFKDAFSSLRKLPDSKCAKIKAFKKEIDGLIFIDERQIPIILPEGGSIGVCQRPLRASTPQGERVALASSETVPAGSKMIFTITMLSDEHEGAVMEALSYGILRGFGQWRNSGKGRFKWTVKSREQTRGAIGLAF